MGETGGVGQRREVKPDPTHSPEMLRGLIRVLGAAKGTELRCWRSVSPHRP